MFVRLLLLQLRVNFSLSALRWYWFNDRKKFLTSIGIMALIVASIGPLFYLYSIFVLETFAAAAPLGQTEVVLTSALVLTAFLIAMLNLGFVLSVFYYSRDLALLVSLPLRPGEILASKFGVVLVYNYLIILPFLLPAIGVFGFQSAIRWDYWLISGVVVLLAPVIPLVVVSLFLLVLMRLTNLSQKRDALRMMGLLGFFLGVLALNWIFGSVRPGEEATFIESVLLAQDGLIHFVSRMYPPALWATRALVASGLTQFYNLLGYLLLSGVGVIGLIEVGQRIFYEGLIGGEEVRRGRHLADDDLGRRLGRVHSPEWAIAMREIKYLIRTPIFFFNSLLILLALPAILLVPVVAGGTLEVVLSGLEAEVPRPVQLLGGGAFIGMMALFAPAASSSFSREGRQFWISQLIPLSARQHIRGKLLYAFLLAALALPVVLLGAWLWLPWRPLEIVIALGAGLILSFPMITLSLWIDLLRPYLDWDSPDKAIKQNINVLLAMLGGSVVFVGLYFWGRFLFERGQDPWMIYGGVLGVALLIGYVFWVLLYRLARIRYRFVDPPPNDEVRER